MLSMQILPRKSFQKRAGKWDRKTVTFSGPLLNAVIETRPGNRAQKPHRFLDKFCTGSRLLYVEPSSHTVRKPSACKATPAQNLHVLLAATCPLSGCCVEDPSMCQPAQDEHNEPPQPAHPPAIHPRYKAEKLETLEPACKPKLFQKRTPNLQKKKQDRGDEKRKDLGHRKRRAKEIQKRRLEKRERRQPEDMKKRRPAA